MAHVIQLAFGVFMRSLGAKGRTKSWEAHEHNQQFGDNESIDIGKSQRVRKEGNARIIKVSAMRPGLATKIEKVRISTYFESPETDIYIAENACCIDYTDTWSLKRHHWLSKSQSTSRGTIYYGWEDMAEFDTGVAWAGTLITRIHPWVALESKIQWLPITLHNTGWIEYREVCHGCVKSILEPDTVNVKATYSYAASHCHCIQHHVRSYGWRYASFG